MKKYFLYLKNKYILSAIVICSYSLFLDENDIFSLVNQHQRLSEIKVKQASMQQELDETKSILLKLESIQEVERFAREEKQFKKDDEDIFVIFNEAK